jgi:hypothetical protein
VRQVRRFLLQVFPELRIETIAMQNCGHADGGPQRGGLCPQLCCLAVFLYGSNQHQAENSESLINDLFDWFNNK